jgi:hypothetical protein
MGEDVSVIRRSLMRSEKLVTVAPGLGAVPAGTRNVDSVHVAVRLVKRAGTFVDVNVRSVIARASASHDHFFSVPEVAHQAWCLPAPGEQVTASIGTGR